LTRAALPEAPHRIEVRRMPTTQPITLSALPLTHRPNRRAVTGRRPEPPESLFTAGVRFSSPSAVVRTGTEQWPSCAPKRASEVSVKGWLPITGVQHGSSGKQDDRPHGRRLRTDRDLIQVSAYAALVLFDPATVSDQASFAERTRPARGLLDLDPERCQ
jgi:hypothetical protein